MTADDRLDAAAFLDEYAARPPRPEANHPAADTPQWRAIQGSLRDIAERFRQLAANRAATFLKQDSVFLEEQSSRLYRMHHWIRKGASVSAHDANAAETARQTAERLLLIAMLVREQIQ
jgi:hypothetical protein